MFIASLVDDENSCAVPSLPAASHLEVCVFGCRYVILAERSSTAGRILLFVGKRWRRRRRRANLRGFPWNVE